MQFHRCAQTPGIYVRSKRKIFFRIREMFLCIADTVVSCDCKLLQSQLTIVSAQSPKFEAPVVFVIDDDITVVQCHVSFFEFYLILELRSLDNSMTTETLAIRGKHNVLEFLCRETCNKIATNQQLTRH